jgi:mRNA interferase MazF
VKSGWSILGWRKRSDLPLVPPTADADRALITVTSHTTKIRGSKFELPVSAPFLKPGAFVVQSVTTLPAKLALRRLGTLSAEELKAIEDGVRHWLAV